MEIAKIFKKILSIGTPPEDEVLYKKVIKKKVPNESAEKLTVMGFKNSLKNMFTNKDKNVESSSEEVSFPVKTVAKKATAKKKTPTKKTSTTKKPTIKKAPTKKSATAIKKPEEKKATTKKPVSRKTITKKKTTTSKSTSKKPAAEKKTKAAPRGAKKAEKIALYTKDITKHYGEVDEDFLAIIVKNLGPSIYKRDAELVSCSDSKELNTVRKNFLIKKLGIDADQKVLDAAIQDVCEELKGTRTKYRATFYYRLAKKFKKESFLT